jgi:Mor family transcriptional regulator
VIRERSLAGDFVAAAREAVGNRQTAVRAVRALCKWFGGQMVYIPLARADGKTAEALRGVLADAVGDRDAETIVLRLMRLFGGVQYYIPKEMGAFPKEIAREIYGRFDGTQGSMNALCREYNCCFTKVYRICRGYLAERAQLHFDFDKTGEGDDDEL